MTMEAVSPLILRFVWGALVAILFGAVVGLITALLSIGRPKIKDGWLVLRPTLFLHGLGVLSIPMGAFMLAFGIHGLLFPSVRALGPHPRLFAAGGVFFGLMFPYCAATTFCVRVRFNDAGVEKSWFGRPTFIPWAEILRINRSFFRGPQLVTTSGRGIAVSDYLLGFSNLLAMAQAKGVEVAREFTQNG